MSDELRPAPAAPEAAADGTAPVLRTTATLRRSRWPGWIWAVPLVAIAIVGWLFLRDFWDRGPEVTVTFEKAGGVRAGDTTVQYRGLQIGKVESVALSKNAHHVLLTLRMDKDVTRELTTGTRFWIAGSTVSLNDLSTLKTIVSGPYIAMDPGPGRAQRHFTGLEQPDLVPVEAQGRRFRLHAAKLGSLNPGASILYHGLAVGTIENDRLVDDGRGFAISAFVKAPYDALVHPGSVFWNAGAVQVVTDGGLSLHLASLGALASGAVAFETSAAAARAPESPADASFPLYDSRSAAEGAPRGAGFDYLTRFDGAVGDLKPGAAVELKGFRIGSVTAVSLAYDATDGRLETPVTLEIEPARLGLAAGGSGRAALDGALDTLIRQGLRARLDQSTPVIGGHIVTLAFAAGAAPARLLRTAPYPQIPTDGSASIAGLTAQAHDILQKIDRLPLPQIADGLHHAIDHVDRLVASPEIKASLRHLDRSLANVDSMTRAARGQVGPLIASLRRTAADAQQTVTLASSVLGGGGGEDQGKDLPQALDELTNAARSIRALANYLDRHPEALIEGKSADNQ